MSGRQIMGIRRAVRSAVILGVFATAAALLAAPANATPAYRIVDLGLGDNSFATGVNDAGHVVGFSESGAFLWRNGRVNHLFPEGQSGRPEDVNNRDEVVGTHTVDGASHGFLWHRGVLTDLGVLPGGTSSFAQAINDHGEVVGFGDTTQGLRAFRWKNGVMTDLGILPGGFLSTAQDINNTGVVVGDADTGGMDRFAVRWRHGGAAERLTTVPSFAVAVNDFGVITGTVISGDNHGFVWHRGQFTEIPAPPSEFMPNLQPHGINNRTQVVGHANADAFLWQRGELTLLPRLASTSTANDINDRGQIAGTSASQSGFDPRFRAVLWTR